MNRFAPRPSRESEAAQALAVEAGCAASTTGALVVGGIVHMRTRWLHRRSVGRSVGDAAVWEGRAPIRRKVPASRGRALPAQGATMALSLRAAGITMLARGGSPTVFATARSNRELWSNQYDCQKCVVWLQAL
jgi:hypothetical protein